MLIDVLNRMLGLIEENQIKDEEHAKKDAEISEMLKRQREQIQLLLQRIEQLEEKKKIFMSPDSTETQETKDDKKKE